MPPFLADVTLGQVAVLVGIVVMVVGAGMKAWPWLSRLKNTLDDWMGEPARPGVPARAGLMQRVGDQEAREVERDAREAARDAREEERDKAVKLLRPIIDAISDKVDAIDYNSRPNGGGSAHDDIMREVSGVRSDLGEHIAQAQTRDDRLTEVESALNALAEAMPIVARSTPHECDAPTHEPEEG